MISIPQFVIITQRYIKHDLGGLTVFIIPTNTFKRRKKVRLRKHVFIVNFKVLSFQIKKIVMTYDTTVLKI